MAECLTIAKYCELLGKINTPTASTYISKLKSIEGKTDTIQISWETEFKITQATTNDNATIEQQNPTSNIKIIGGITASDISDDYVEVIPTIDCNNCENILALDGNYYFKSAELKEQQTCAKDPILPLVTLQGSADAKIKPYYVTIPNPYIFQKPAVLLHGDYILGKAKLTSSPTGCAKNENLTRSEEGGVVTITYTAELPIKYGVCVNHLIKDLLTEIAIEQEFTDEDGNSCTLLSPRKAYIQCPSWFIETGIVTPLYFLGDYLCGDADDTEGKINGIIDDLVGNQNTEPEIDTIYADTYYTQSNSDQIKYEQEVIRFQDYQDRGAKSIEEYLTMKYNNNDDDKRRIYSVIGYEDEEVIATYTTGIFIYGLACTKIEKNSMNCGQSQPSKLHFKRYSNAIITLENGGYAIRIRRDGENENILDTLEIPVTAYGSEEA